MSPMAHAQSLLSCDTVSLNDKWYDRGLFNVLWACKDGTRLTFYTHTEQLDNCVLNDFF